MSTFPILQKKAPLPNFTATRNACKLCAPLGAALAIRGVEGALPYLHGSQGCATYMRRYIISHFREPMDIAASNFSEASTVFGGAEVFSKGIHNVNKSYKPSMIGIATTCLTETIGEDMKLLLNRVETWTRAGSGVPASAVICRRWKATSSPMVSARQVVAMPIKRGAY